MCEYLSVVRKEECPSIASANPPACSSSEACHPPESLETGLGISNFARSECSTCFKMLCPLMGEPIRDANVRPPSSPRSAVAKSQKDRGQSQSPFPHSRFWVTAQRHSEHVARQTVITPLVKSRSSTCSPAASPIRNPVPAFSQRACRPG